MVADVHRRTEGRPVLITSDAYPVNAEAIRHVYGAEVERTPTGRAARRMVPERVPPPGLTYATVEKRRRLGRVVEVLVPPDLRHDGGAGPGPAAVARSRRVNVSFLERYHATDRHKDARKVRRTYTFSKDWRVHESMTYFTMYSYNFCWPVRTLEHRDEDGRVPKEVAGDGGRAGRSRLDDARMDHDALCSMR